VGFAGRSRAFVLIGFVAAAIASPFALGGEQAPPVTPLERVAALVQPSVTYLSITWTAAIYDRYNQSIVGSGQTVAQAGFQCSGFFVSPNGHVMTASHCTEYNSEVRDALIQAAGEWTWKNNYYAGSVTEREALDQAQSYFEVRKPQSTVTVVWSRAADGSNPVNLPARQIGTRQFLQGDVALLKLETQNTIPLELATNDVQIGTPIVAVGFPGEVDDVTDADKVNPSFKDGTISSKKTIAGGLRGVYEVSAAIAGGMSGGPTVDDEGRVVGINSFGATYQTEQFNFVSPSSIAEELLKDKGIPQTESKDAALLREGISAVLDRKRNKALDALGQIVDREPDWQIAATYRARALALPKESGGLPIWAIPLLAIGGACLLGGGGLLLSRRRSLPLRRQPSEAAPAAGAPSPGGVDRTVVTREPGPLPTLVIVDGSRGGERVPIRGETTIGRADADVVVDDSEVSRLHAVVRRLDGTLEISDAGSANGTFVNGSRISGARRLADGEVVKIGMTRLRVELPPSAATAPRAPFPTLVVTSGARSGDRIPVTSELSIGREHADVVLDDSEVSRRHAVIRLVHGMPEISDANSANGTFVNGSRIDGERRLVDGDVIKVGKTTFEIKIAATSDSTEVASSVPQTIVASRPARREP
jgi:serine protease Do